MENEKKILSRTEEGTQQKLKKLQSESSKIIEQLNEKCKSAKKTAQNYKQVKLKFIHVIKFSFNSSIHIYPQYSDEKENHYRSECERIKNKYADALEKIQNRFKDTLQEKEKAFNDKLKEYEFKIEVLKDLLEKAQR